MERVDPSKDSVYNKNEKSETDKGAKKPKKKEYEININFWFVNKIKRLPGLEFVDKHKHMVKLSKANSRRIEFDISHNEDYSLNIADIVLSHHGGINAVMSKNSKTEIQDIVRMIDLENSTNAWRMKGKQRQGLKAIVDFIVNPGNHFWDKAKNGDINLVDKLWKYLSDNDDAAEIKSLASKVCRYFNEKLSNEENGSYYAYDSVVLDILPFYLSKNKISLLKKKHTYLQFREKLDDLCSVACNNALTRLELDHLLWYSYRKQKI